MNLESIVPPLELCKRIPKGKFDDSALVWALPVTFPDTAKYYDVHPRLANTTQAQIPAPTLAEIMAELPKRNQIGVSLEIVPSFVDNGDVCVFGEAWAVGYMNEYNIPDRSAATAALKLWLKLKGIEVK